MKRHIIVSGLMIAWFVTGAFGAPPPPTPRAQNLRVILQDVYVDEYACAFHVQVDTFADARIHYNYDATGKLVKTLITTPHGRMTWTNLENRKSVSTPLNGVTFFQTNPDRSTKWGWSGVQVRIVVRGQGVVLADLGRVAFITKFDPSGKVMSTSLIRSGMHDGVVTAHLCDFLD